ncbi:MAG: hypothetical protein GY927_22915, partial [bacterium]|nr:hypothetical protein [bacterium]
MIVSLVISFVAVFWYYTIIAPKEEKAYYRQNPNVQLAEHSQYLKTVATKGIVDRSLLIIVPATMLSVGILLFIGIPIGLYRLKAKKAAVHGFEIGKHNKFVVHENDLSIAAPLAMGLMTGQQLRETNTGQEQAFEFYTKMAEVQTKQIQALKPHASAQPTQIDPAHINPGAFPQIVEHLTHPDRIPAFQQLLDTGE